LFQIQPQEVFMGTQTVTREYANSLGKIKIALQIVLDRLNKPQPQRDKALEELSHAAEQWSNQTQELATAAPDQGERNFLRAAAEIRVGQLVVVAAQAAESGDEKALREEIGLVESEQQQAESGHLVALFFEQDLLNVSNRPTDADEALKQFKERSIRTLDNMVTETSDVVSEAWDKFKDKFDAFVGALGDLAKSFSASVAGGWIRWGIEKIVSGLKALAEFLKSDSLGTAIDYLKQLGANFSPDKVMADAFHRDGTAQDIQNLSLEPSSTADQVNSAAGELAAIATRFVNMMKQARWVIKGIAVAGGLLTLVGVTAVHAAAAVPIAYAVVAVAVIIIGMDFADAGPVDLIPGVRSVVRTL
jgi:hypothetical protein